MPFIFPPPPQTSLPIEGSDKHFPIRRVFCVGRNYAAHTIEMGGDPDRPDPFFFTKPADAVVDSGATIEFPTKTDNLHHEMELVVAIGQAGKSISIDQALNHVFGYGAGVDLTRRDLQDEAKEKRRPWDMSKGFDQSAPISAIAPASEIGHPESARIVLSVDGEIRQDADIDHQIWKVPEIVSYLSFYVGLEPGDLIMTGTPAGVGPIKPGQKVEGEIEGVGKITFEFAERNGHDGDV